MRKVAFPVVLVLVIAFSVATAIAITHDSTDCSSRNRSVSPGDVPVKVTEAIELPGNTPAVTNEARMFVESDLADAGKADPTRTLEVRLVFVRDGRTYAPHQSCLTKPLVLEAPTDDVRALRDGSNDSHADALASIEKRRASDIALVGEAVANEVSTTDFSETQHLSLSPLAMWVAADGHFDRLGLLGTWTSNTGDCLDTASAPEPPDEQTVVAGCVNHSQMTRLGTPVIHIAFFRSLAATGPQQRIADSAIEALCKEETISGCAPTSVVPTNN